MHGFVHGCLAIEKLIENFRPDVSLSQEHWPTLANSSNIYMFCDYFSFDCSAMNNCAESGTLAGLLFDSFNSCLRRLVQCIVVSVTL
jgi:hypothetical protein